MVFISFRVLSEGQVVFYLLIYERLYSLHTNFLCFIDERKLDRVLLETERNWEMANLIAQRTFAAYHSLDKNVLPTGPQVVELTAGDITAFFFLEDI